MPKLWVIHILWYDAPYFLGGEYQKILIPAFVWRKTTSASSIYLFFLNYGPEEIAKFAPKVSEFVQDRMIM